MGRDVWVPVAQYRPNSWSTIYRANARTLVVECAFEDDDHTGAIVVAWINDPSREALMQNN